MGTARGTQREALGDHEAAAVAAVAEAQLIAARERGGEEHCVLERDLRRGQHQAERLERLAQQLPARHAGERSARGASRGAAVTPAATGGTAAPPVAAPVIPAGTTPSKDSMLASNAVSCCRRSERVK